MRGSGGTGRGLLALALAGVLVAALTGCVDATEMPTPTPTTTIKPGSASPTPTATPVPEINLSGTATENQPYFDKVNKATVKSGGDDGRSFIDGLVAAGYSKATMEVTPDRTAINAQADTYQFSVRLNGTCLIGQYGGAGYASLAAPVLADGNCLIGTTRPIDW